MLGANPLASNGSLMTAPDMRGRLAAIRERGGKVVVVDPRRTRTAEEADEHHFIRPGTDALLLFGAGARVSTRASSTRAALAEHLDGLDEVRELRARRSRPRRSRRPCGIDADEIRRMARELAAAPSGRRLRPDRHLHAGVRHAGELAGRRAQRAHRQPRPRGRRDVHAAPPRASATRAARPARAAA